MWIPLFLKHKFSKHFLLLLLLLLLLILFGIDDFRNLFKGNVDDCFCLGIKLSRRNIKLYSDFYSSDIIIGSPLGLRRIVGAPGYAKINKQKIYFLLFFNTNFYFQRI